jgi:hypothetical protein
VYYGDLERRVAGKILARKFFLRVLPAKSTELRVLAAEDAPPTFFLTQNPDPIPTQKNRKNGYFGPENDHFRGRFERACRGHKPAGRRF